MVDRKHRRIPAVGLTSIPAFPRRPKESDNATRDVTLLVGMGRSVVVAARTAKRPGDRLGAWG